MPLLFRVAVRSLAVIAPAICVFNYVMNHFFVQGAYFLDSGWFAYLVANPVWPLPNPPLLDGSYFATHVAGMFYLGGLFDALLPGDAVQALAALQAFWSAVIAAAVLLLAESLGLCARSLGRLAAALLAGATALSGPVLVSLGMPHPEIAMPALILLSLALRVRRRWWAAAFVVGLAVLAREDGGLHAALVYGGLGVWHLLRPARHDAGRRDLAMALGAASAALAILLYQDMAFPTDDALTRIYLGDPPLSHLTVDLLRERLAVWFTERLDLMAPLVVLLGWAAVSRRMAPALGVAIVMPWLLVQLVARKTGPAVMLDYYAFPLLLAVAWPLVAAALDRQRAPARPWRAVSLQAATVGLSIGLLPLADVGLKDIRPWQRFGFTYTETYAPTQRFLAAHRAHPAAPGFLLMGDGVASLMPELVGQATWLRERGPPQAWTRYDTVFAFATSKAHGAARAAFAAEGGATSARIRGTSIVVLTRRPPDTLPYKLVATEPTRTGSDRAGSPNR